MGDRAVTGFRETRTSPVLYLYSHWGATSQDGDLRAALLAARPRWAEWIDPNYATRICISQMIGDDWDRETGYGLSIDGFTMPDVPWVIVVTWDERVVEWIGDDHAKQILRSVPLSEYILSTGQIVPEVD